MTEKEMQALFYANPAQHVYMLSTHGVHDWEVVPGLIDTGGQNIFVNQFATALAAREYKITIINRGGYHHPVSGLMRRGLHYRSESLRLLFLEDGIPAFIRKEDMGDKIEPLAGSLSAFAEEEGLPIDLIISHYWDAAAIAETFMEKMDLSVPHVWIPHSLGRIKKSNVPPSTWGTLRIDERISWEEELLSHLVLVGSTSPRITEALKDDYGYSGRVVWLPPCIDTGRFYPHVVAEDTPIWDVLREASGKTIATLRKKKIITEISRTDRTKRKDILIQAFARIREIHTDALLAITIDPARQTQYKRLMDLIHDLGLREHVAVLGSVWDELPDLYAVTSIYCTPSIMEGFGMSAQEAASSAVPVVASTLVPFAVDYLFGEPGVFQEIGPDQHFLVGKGAVLVRPDDVDGFALALDLLLTDGELLASMGEHAYLRTIPAFTWPRVVNAFLDELK